MPPKSPFRLGRPVLVLVLLAGIGAAFVLAFHPARRATVHLERGKLYLGQGRAAAAQAEFERSRELAPPGWEAQYLIGRALAADGRGADAVAVWRGLRETPVAGRALAEAAEQARLDGTTDVALAICADARADGHSPIPFLAVEARILRAQRDVPGAVERYREALALNPRRADLASELATTLRNGGKLDAAAAVLDEALGHASDLVPLLIQRAELAKQQEQTETALALYRRAVDQDPARAAARTALMELLADAGDWDAAEAEARRLVGTPEAEPLARFMLGQVAYQRRDFRTAVAELEAAKTFMPRDPMVLLWLGRALRQQGDVEGGLASLQAAAAYAPRAPEIQLALLRALWEGARFEEAWEVADRFPGEPTDPEVRALLDQVLQSDASALAALDADTLIQRAEAALVRRDFGAAQRAAAVAQHRAPDDPRPFVALALVAAARQDMRTALGYLEEGRTRSPGNASVAINRARLLRGLGRPDLAVATLQAAIAAPGAQVEALLPETAKLLLAQGRARDAEALLRDHAPDPLPEALAVVLGEALLLQGRPGTAAARIASLPSRGARLCHARALLALRRDAEARAVLLALAAEGPAPEFAAVADLLVPASEAAAEAAADPIDHPLARACAVARGRVEPREAVAREGGRLGALLGLLALVRTPGAEGAEAWRAAHVVDGPPLAAGDLPAQPGAFAAGLVCQMMQWPGAALRFYADAGATRHPLLLEALIDCTVALGRPEDALRLAEAATAEAPAPARLWVRYADLAREVRGPEAAAAALDRAPAAAADSPALLALAGRLAAARGAPDEAAALYRRAVDAGAGPGVQNDLAWLLAAEAATVPDAIALAAAAFAEAPFTPGLADTLGWCHLKSDQPDQALYYHNLAVLLDPFTPELRAHRAEALVRTGRWAAARADCGVLQQAAAGSPLAPEVQALCSQVGT